MTCIDICAIKFKLSSGTNMDDSTRNGAGPLDISTLVEYSLGVDVPELVLASSTINDCCKIQGIFFIFTFSKLVFIVAVFSSLISESTSSIADDTVWCCFSLGDDECDCCWA